MIAAFLAGLLMFLAPCTLPIVPGYLVFIGGKRVLANAVAFVLGFSFVFIVFGTFAGFLGALVGPYRELFWRTAGLMLVLFGLTMLGVFRIPGLSATWQAKLPKFLHHGHPESSLLVGALFALGWSPCIGPILGSVLLLASISATVPQGALLLGVFSLGLAVPFLLTALLLKHAHTTFAAWGRVTHIFQMIGGFLLLVFGVLMLFGQAGLVTSFALTHTPHYSALLLHL